MKTQTFVAAAAMLLLANPLALAEPFIIHAKIVNAVAVPVTRTVTGLTPACRRTLPEDAGLATLLAWDLGCEQPRVETVSRWQVSYLFDGRRLGTLTDEKPGETLPIKVRLDKSGWDRFGNALQ